MPVKIPDGLPAAKKLAEENIFVMTEKRAIGQDIRPLKIAILNLMPTKIVTEEQLLRLLGNNPLQVEITLLHMDSHISQNTPPEHLQEFYTTWEKIKEQKFDGLIVTGAPVEKMSFADVDYWPELESIFEWTKTNVFTSMYICWGAQAALYYFYNIKKYPLEKKLSGIYSHELNQEYFELLRGFDDCFYAPHSRYTEVRAEDVAKVPELNILATSKKAGLFMANSNDKRRVFITGHLEYDEDTLAKEYFRDIEAGLNPQVPENYFPNDDPTKKPFCIWRSHAHLLFNNWLNYYVYQKTPYDVSKIG